MKINVPTQWGDVTLGQYQAISQLDRETYTSDLKYSSDIVQLLCDIPNVHELPINVLAELSEHITFLSDDVTKERLTSFKHNGKEYEWIGNFNEVTVGEQLSIEQTIDIEELTVNESFDVVCAVLLREDGKPFDSNNFKDNRELFNSFPVTKLLGMVLFFLNGGQLHTEIMAAYSIVPMSTQTNIQTKNSLLKKLFKKMVQFISGLQWWTS